MPEIKNAFTQGRMNKDLDERLIPRGQYRDAMNVQVSTSEGSDVGTVQNILGNERIEDIVPISGGYKCVGSIANEKNNTLYWFITKKHGLTTVDAIVEYKKDFEPSLILVDTKQGDPDAVLKFPDNVITGINIIDDLLLWTDNNNEPKKINIERCKQGTSGTLNNPQHTKLVVDGNITDDDITEAHITVVKKSPKNAPTVKINTTTELSNKNLFEKTFSRFAVRYKYEDNEYSAIGPFTNIVFSSKYTEGYDIDTAFSVKEPYNTAMLNSIESVELTDFIPPNIPKDVVQVDILYKKEDSPSVYSVASIKPDDNEWTTDGSNANSSFKGKYIVNSENIYAVLPQNQTLRPWDNVPRKALGQEVTGNRVIYGNYIQNYNLDVEPSLSIGFDLRGKDNDFYDGGLPSLKSQRNYQLGIVFGDEYGRETPVYTSTDAAINIPWEDSNIGKCASNSLQLTTSIDSDIPSWAKYYKFFIKENSGEYYNLVMDKAYVPSIEIDSEEEHGHIWISFPSSDRNKLTEETYLTLKKKIGTGEQQIQSENRYKILDIKNEAPDAVKFTHSELGNVRNTKPDATPANTTQLTDDVFLQSDFRIDKQVDTIEIDRTGWRDTHDNSPLMVGTAFDAWNEHLFISWSTGDPDNAEPVQTSKRYRVTGMPYISNSNSTGVYKMKLEEKISEKDAALAAHASDPALLNVDLVFKAERKLKKDLDEFSGRFFVKVVSDDVTGSNIEQNVTTELLDNHIVASQKGSYWFADARPAGDNETTGVVHAQDNGTIPTGTDAVSEQNGGLATTTSTVTAWGELDDYINSDVSTAKFFIDSMYFCGGQNSTESYAKNAGNIIRGIGNQYAAVEWTDRIQTLAGDAYAQGINNAGFRWWPFDYDNNTTANDPIVHPNAVVNEVSSNTINGMDGIIKTNQGGQHTSTDGIRRWRKEGPLATIGIPNSDYSFDDTYGPDDGKERYFIHLSFLAPGADLVPDPVAVDLATLTGKDSLANHLQGIWGGGVFCKEDQTTPNFGSSGQRIIEMEGNYDSNGVAQRKQPGPGVGQGYNEAYAELHQNQWNPSYPASRDANGEIQEFISNIVVGGRFKFADDGDEVVYTILSKSIKRIYNHTPWKRRKIYDGTNFVFANDSVEEHAELWAETATLTNDGGSGTTNATANSIDGGGVRDELEAKIQDFGKADNRRVCYIIEVDKNPIDQTYNPLANADVDSSLNIQFVKNDPRILAGSVSKQPAVWETEPKQIEELDIYYEASDAIPTSLTIDNRETFAPVGCKVDFLDVPEARVGANNITQDVLLDSWDSATEFTLSPGFNFDDANSSTIDYRGHQLRFYKQDGSYVTAKVSPTTLDTPLTSNTNAFVTEFTITSIIDPDFEIGLSWFNCFSFGNGVESDRVRDGFNEMQITNGAKASATTEQPYEEEHRKHGLIYSGLYNSNSGLNDLNQFIMADKITKDLNPTFGSIQKLFQRRTSLVAFCEDRVVNILSNRDALFNADGNPQLISSTAVLGDATPFIGDYGISKNPESFAKETYRAYFADKQRGAVLRLSHDGITPISDAGMHDWFRDNLIGAGFLIGTYDEYKKDYNLTLSSPILENLLTNADITEGVTIDQFLTGPEIINNGGVNDGVLYSAPLQNIEGMDINDEDLISETTLTHHPEIGIGDLQDVVSEVTNPVALVDRVWNDTRKYIYQSDFNGAGIDDDSTFDPINKARGVPAATITKYIDTTNNGKDPSILAYDTTAGTPADQLANSHTIDQHGGDNGAETQSIFNWKYHLGNIVHNWMLATNWENGQIQSSNGTWQPGVVTGYPHYQTNRVEFTRGLVFWSGNNTGAVGQQSRTHPFFTIGYGDNNAGGTGGKDTIDGTTGSTNKRHLDGSYLEFPGVYSSAVGTPDGNFDAFDDTNSDAMYSNLSQTQQQFPNAEQNTIFNGEEVEVEFLCFTPGNAATHAANQTLWDDSSSVDPLSRFRVELYDGATLISDNVLITPTTNSGNEFTDTTYTPPASTATPYSDYHPTVSPTTNTSQWDDYQGTVWYNEGWQNTNNVTTTGAAINYNSDTSDGGGWFKENDGWKSARWNFKFYDASITDGNGNPTDGIVVQDLKVRLVYESNGNGDNNFGVQILQNVSVSKTRRVDVEIPASNTVTTHNVPAFPDVVIPAWTQVEHAIDNSWSASTSTGVDLHAQATTLFGVNTGGGTLATFPVQNTIDESLPPITSADTFLLPPGMSVSGGNVSGASTAPSLSTSYGAGTEIVDDKFSIDCVVAGEDITITQDMLNVGYEADKWYLLDLSYDTAPTQGNAIVPGVAPSGSSDGDQLIDHTGTVYDDNGIKGIKLIPATRVANEYGTGTGTVLRAIFKVDSTSAINSAAPPELNILKIKFTDDFIGEVTQIRLIDISETTASGTANHWMMDSHALDQLHALSTPTLCYNGNLNYAGFNWNDADETMYVKQVFDPSIGSAASTSDSDGFELTFTISEAVDKYGIAIPNVSGGLEGYINTAIGSGTDFNGLYFSGINTAGDYIVSGMLDGTGTPTMTLDGATHGSVAFSSGATWQGSSVTTTDITLEDQIYFSPIHGGTFTGNLSNISLVDTTDMFAGGAAEAWNFGGYDITAQQYIQFFIDAANVVNPSNITFTDAPATYATNTFTSIDAGGPVRLEQRLTNVVRAGEWYRVKFDYNITSGKINGYYYNLDTVGKGFVLDEADGIDGSGTFDKLFKIGDANALFSDTSTEIPGASGVWSDSALRSTFVIYVQTGNVNGTIDNITMQREYPEYRPQTITYSEDVKGWVSFKSFGTNTIEHGDLTLEHGNSMAKKYFTMHKGGLYEHHVQGANRNEFYGTHVNSTLTAVLNEMPSTIKIFNTLNYEGSQSKIDEWKQNADGSINNADTYNVYAKSGWYIDHIQTDKQSGTLTEFVEKEGKWFNYIRGSIKDEKSMTSEFSFQGLGIISSVTTVSGSLAGTTFDPSSINIIDPGGVAGTY